MNYRDTKAKTSSLNCGLATAFDVVVFGSSNYNWWTELGVIIGELIGRNSRACSKKNYRDTKTTTSSLNCGLTKTFGVVVFCSSDYIDIIRGPNWE